MATISNVGARGLYRQNGVISYFSDWAATQIQVGYYNVNTSYAIQLRFRLDKPASAITLVVQGASGSGGTYHFRVSDKIEDDELMERMFTQGGEAGDTEVDIAWNGSSFYGEATIEGNFPANTDLYIYGYRYSTIAGAAKNLYGLYNSSWYSKVIDAEEMQGFLYLDTGAEIKPFCVLVDNSEELKRYRVMIDTGEEIKPYGS